MNKKLEKIPGYSKIDKLINNKQAIVFLVCVLIATALWFLNALSKDYSTTISYPVRYVNAPNRQFLSNKPPSELDLKVEAHGFTLLRHKLSFSFSPIVLSLSNLTEDIEPTNRTYRVQINHHLRRISSQVSNEIKILEVQPEILVIVLDSLISKSVPVKADISYDFKPQFNLKNPVVVSPETIKITGPASTIDTINFLSTKMKLFDGLDASLEKSLEILHPEKTTIFPEKVTVRIDVEKFTEKELKVPIQIKNRPTNVNLKLFPSEIKVSCMVGLSEFDNINPSDFSAVVDYNSISDETIKLAITIESKPSFIELNRFAPQTVEYLIETKLLNGN
jgi:hypothetical protein